jgi:hypothetical protein
MQYSVVRADSGHSLRSRANHVATLEADIQATLKFGFSLHRRITAKSPLRKWNLMEWRRGEPLLWTEKWF